MMNKSGLKPLGYRVIIETKEHKQTTEGGIYLPPTVSEREEMAQMEGVLVAKGPEAWDGEGPELGSKVLFAKYAGYLHTKDDVKFRVVNDEDVVAIIGEDNGS